MKTPTRRRLIAVAVLCWLPTALLVGRIPNHTAPRAPLVASQPTLPVAYPGNKIAFDQTAQTPTEASLIRHTIAWDESVKADLTGQTCTPFASGMFTCTFPIPASTAAGTHTIALTAYLVVNGTRYESAVTLFSLTYEVPAAPPAPTGCRIVR